MGNYERFDNERTFASHRVEAIAVGTGEELNEAELAARTAAFKQDEVALTPEELKAIGMLSLLERYNPQSEIYKRQAELSIDAGQPVAIVGCGGIGSWIALFLALAGVSRISLFDGDEVSVHNLNRLPLQGDAIGKVKSEAVAALLQQYRPGGEFTPYMNFDIGSQRHKDILTEHSWVVCTTDSLKSRRMVYQACQSSGAAYIEAGAEGHSGSVAFSPADFSTEAEDNPGYRSVPVFVGPCTLVASIVTYYVLLGCRCKHSHTLSWNSAGYFTRSKFRTDPISMPLLTLATHWERDEDKPGYVAPTLASTLAPTEADTEAATETPTEAPAMDNPTLPETI